MNLNESFIKRRIAFVAFSLLSITTGCFSQDSTDLLTKIELVRSQLSTAKNLIKKEDVHFIINKKAYKEFIQRFKLIDSLTNILVSSDRLHSTISKSQRHDIWETYYYDEGDLKYATVSDEIKFKDGRANIKYGFYQFHLGKLVSKKEENNIDVNVETLLANSKAFTF